MHEIQSALLQTIRERGLKELPPLRKLADMAGKQLSAQQVKHHIGQLINKGFISLGKDKQITLLGGQVAGAKHSTVISLPIYGVANCGVALSMAEQRPEGFLKASSSMLKNMKTKDLFVVRASGDSMNRAVVGEKTIEDGDYLIIDSSKISPRGKGEIVLSIIDGAANIKRIFKEGDHIALVSDSTKQYPPIYIHQDDDFILNGTVVEVMKLPLKSQK